jgi:hypothetical protein
VNPMPLFGFSHPVNMILLMVILLVATIRPLAADVSSGGIQPDPGHYQDQLELLDDFLEFRDPNGHQCAVNRRSLGAQFLGGNPVP